jgi:hypothetical protein
MRCYGKVKVKERAMNWWGEEIYLETLSNPVSKNGKRRRHPDNGEASVMRIAEFGMRNEEFNITENSTAESRSTAGDGSNSRASDVPNYKLVYLVLRNSECGIKTREKIGS